MTAHPVMVERRRVLAEAESRIFRCPGCGALRYRVRIGRWYREQPACTECGTRDTGRPVSRRVTPAEHGTDSGYYRHRRDYRWDDTPCDDCRAAHAAAERDRARRARA